MLVLPNPAFQFDRARDVLDNGHERAGIDLVDAQGQDGAVVWNRELDLLTHDARDLTEAQDAVAQIG